MCARVFVYCYVFISQFSLLSELQVRKNTINQQFCPWCTVFVLDNLFVCVLHFASQKWAAVCLTSSDDAVRQPTVSVYSSTKSQKENTFLCHASNMFPDLVRFHWKVFKAGKWENVVKNDREVLETSFSDKTNTSIMIIDKQKAGGNRYACSYTHEALREGKESKPLEIEGKKGTTLLFTTLASIGINVIVLNIVLLFEIFIKPAVSK